tara:strand:- start:860 stop:1183 length:324 start_codon:yes stop_codon:yes gene_type:complete
MARRAGANVEGDLGVPLLLSGPQVLEGGHAPDELLAEGGEVVGTGLGGRDNQDVVAGVQEKLMNGEYAGEPGLPYASVSHDQQPAGTVLEVLRDVILNRRWLWEVQV